MTHNFSLANIRTINNFTPVICEAVCEKSISANKYKHTQNGDSIEQIRANIESLVYYVQNKYISMQNHEQIFELLKIVAMDSNLNSESNIKKTPTFHAYSDNL